MFGEKKKFQNVCEFSFCILYIIVIKLLRPVFNNKRINYLWKVKLFCVTKKMRNKNHLAIKKHTIMKSILFNWLKEKHKNMHENKGWKSVYVNFAGK